MNWDRFNLPGIFLCLCGVYYVLPIERCAHFSYIHFIIMLSCIYIALNNAFHSKLVYDNRTSLRSLFLLHFCAGSSLLFVVCAALSILGVLYSSKLFSMANVTSQSMTMPYFSLRLLFCIKASLPYLIVMYVTLKASEVWQIADTYPKGSFFVSFAKATSTIITAVIIIMSIVNSYKSVHVYQENFDGWQTISLPGICTFQLPPSLELADAAEKK